MKLLFGYTLDYIKRNRRGSIAIMIAIFMTSTMMSALCGFFYNTYSDNLRLILQRSGNWHGELYDQTYGNQLSTIATFDSIEATMIKGDWKVAKINDSNRNYLVWRDANAAYWNSMPEGSTAILEGRAPEKVGEIALSKQYFEHHPELRLGDTITLPVGNRIATDGRIIIPQNTAQYGERFEQTDTVSLTLVGKLDVATSSTVPTYTALGFLDPNYILPQDGLTVYFRFHNIHDTYKELPKIAEAVGYEKDEYGKYLLRYNTNYLTRKGVLSPEQKGVVPLLLANQMPLMFAVMGLMVVSLFVLIIHNAFSLSSSARLTQLGIFSSVGATPKQVKHSVVSEALLLTIIPLPIGLLLGQIVVGLFMNLANRLGSGTKQELMKFVIGWPSVLPAIGLALLTVLWSALIPARKIARMSPIVAIRQGETAKLKKSRVYSITKLGEALGLSGELAVKALQARKKNYRTATISLTLSFLSFISLLCINSASIASEVVYQTNEKMWGEQDILVTLYNVATPQEYSTITKKIESLNGMKSIHWYNSLRTVAWLSEDEFSAAFEERGGFDTVEKELSGTQVPLLRDGQRRVGVTILGLDDATFSTYCHMLGIDPATFYEDGEWRSILYHTVEDVGSSTKRNQVPIPFLKVVQGDTITLTETTIDSYNGDFTFDMKIAAIANRMPSIGSATFNTQYSVVQVMPMEQTRKLASHFAQSNIVRVNGVMQVLDPTLIPQTRNATEQICESYFGSGDYRIFDESEYIKDKASEKVTLTLMFGFVVLLLAVIGLSNAWSTVRGTLEARRLEFSILRSIGQPPKEFQKMLLMEALLLGLTPIILSFPVLVILQGIFLSINEVSFLEWLPYAPWFSLLCYIFSIIAVIVVAYITGGHKLLRENIIDAIKTDFI